MNLRVTLAVLLLQHWLVLCSAEAASKRRLPLTSSGTKRTSTICKDKRLTLQCDKGKRLYISSAKYGFDDLIPQSCTSAQTLVTAEPVGCLSSTAELKVKEQCHNRRTCSVDANDETFGEFCPGIGKYLKITYICVPRNIMKTDGTLDGAGVGQPPVEGVTPAPSRSSNVGGGATATRPAPPGTTRTNLVGFSTSVNTRRRSPPFISPVSTHQDSADTDSDCNCTQLVPVDHKHSPSNSGLVFGWIHSMTYIKENQEKIVLYGVLCGCLAFILALVAFILRMFYVKYRKSRGFCAHQKLNVTEPAIQDISNEENTYIAAGDPSDMIQYNRGYCTEATNRLNSGPGSYRGSSATRVYNNEPETHRFNTNSLTVTNPLHTDHRRNFNHSPLTTASTAMNNSPNTALSDNRNTYYENSGDDEHTNEDNEPRASTSHMALYSDARPRTNSLFDRHS